jgi:hypothetical protein
MNAIVIRQALKSNDEYKILLLVILLLTFVTYLSYIKILTAKSSTTSRLDMASSRASYCQFLISQSSKKKEDGICQHLSHSWEISCGMMLFSTAARSLGVSDVADEALYGGNC